MNINKIRIGTSGYSFKDWVGPFYPQDIPQGKMLDFYAQHFNTVEINSTYYKIPHSKIFWYLSQKTPDDFEFVVKTNKETTHVRKESKTACKELQESIQPLKDSNKFKGFLAQFPYSFKLTSSNLQYLAETNDFLEGDQLFVEFRHRSWLKPEVYNFLKNDNIGYVCVDQPQLSNLLPPQGIATVDTGYVRFHGRNYETWWDSSKGDRYDYVYTKNELENWKERILKMLLEVKKLYLFFNNCHHGHAVSNAFEMKDIFSQE